ncbi:MAG: pyrimidine-nucleoside phosphorylase [Armatimonadetes bacterium]|nr:pyrimidine-nucleoside phosphorylase [Armatimonadota bacterium]
MRVYDLIFKKREAQALTKEELDFLISGYANNNIPDYQISAFLMAVYFQGMSKEEIAYLTLAMANSGDKIDLSCIPGIKVDKHSTGGVGDTTTLILAPLVSSAGIPLAKISGRGLGHTGGTIDKLEAIPDFKVNLTHDEFINQVKKINLGICAQSSNLVPADKKLYALRDVTATIESIPLISSSIMSKKIASGADAILLDVKVGSGAFMKTLKEARNLALTMVKIGKLVNKKTSALITNMEEPLGSMIGNALEVKEAILILNGKIKDSPLKEVSLTLGAHLLKLGGKARNFKEGWIKINQLLNEGKGIEKLKELIKFQGGNPKAVEDLNLLPQASIFKKVFSPYSGYISKIDAQKAGYAAMLLGAGREKKEDKIDLGVGIILNKKVGDKVNKGEVLAEILGNLKEKVKISEEVLLSAFYFSKKAPQVSKLILDFIERQ